MAVSIVSTDDPADVRRALNLIGGIDRFVKSGDRVVIKPNICAGKPSDTGAVTDPAVVLEVCKVVSECGGQPVVCESPIYPFPSSRVFRRAGYDDFENRYGYPLLDIDSSPSKRVRIPEGVAIDHAVISEEVLKCDVLINVPVLKTHLQTTVSLGLKNLKGVVVGKQKHLIHLSGLNEGIVDLNTLVKSHITIIDGIIGMEGGGGPTNGRPVRMNVIVASDNVVEADSTGVRIMGGDPKAVEHIRLAADRGLGVLDGFDIYGAGLEAVSRKLDLPKRPDFNRMLISGMAIRIWDAFRRPAMKVLRGEQVERRPRLGELVIDHDLCDGCRLCLEACPVGALSFTERLECDRKTCLLCFCCAEVCPKGALSKET